MDPEASSSRSSSDSFTTGSTSRSTSNPEDEGRSRPPDEVPKLVSAEQHQSESTESGIEDEATFPVAHPASDDYNGSVFHAFSVDNSYKALKPIHVEGANNGVLFENRSSSSEGDDSVVEVSNNVLVDLDGIELPSPNAMSNSPSEPFVRVEQVHEVQPAFYSDICQENERILRKAASVAKNPNMAEYLLWKNQTIDNELCNVEQQQKQRNDELQLQLHFKGKEVESLRYELDETKRENKVLRRMLEWEIRKGVIEMDTKNHEKACLRMKQPKLRKLNDPREQLAKTEQQFESCQQQIRKLKDENAELHARNAVNEAEVVKLEKEKTAAIDRITEKEEELQVLVSTFYRLIEERFEYVHLQLCCVSKTYALHYPKARTVSLAAALHLEASSLSPNTASSSVRPSMKGRRKSVFSVNISKYNVPLLLLYYYTLFSAESSSMPVGADVVAPFPCPDQNLSSKYNYTVN